MDRLAKNDASDGGAVHADGGEEKMMTPRNDHGLLHERNQEAEELRSLESKQPDDEAQLENGVGPGNNADERHHQYSDPDKGRHQEKVEELAVIAKDLNKIKRQNTVTHVLLGTVILMTAAWQVNEVSFLLWAQRKLSDPFKSLGDLIKGSLLKLRGRRPVIESSPLPPVGVPDVTRADLPTLVISGQHR